MAENTMSNSMMVLGLLNGMIGGTILVLPILGISAGYVNTLLICLFLGVIQYFTNYLIILHIGRSKSINQCILAHFNQSQNWARAYSCIIWISFTPTFFIYFRLIVLQIQGLIGQSPLIAPICALLLFIVICVVRIYEIGQQTLALGIVTFLIWAQVTAPPGEKSIQPFGEVYPLTSSLTMAYAIHNIVTNNIYKNPNHKDYVRLVGYTFICGIAAYTFITFGSYAIVNRTSIKNNPETIEDYFEMGGWQITIIEGLYLIHLFTAYPNFLIISKRRFYQLIKVELKSKVSWYEILYIFIVVGISLLIYLTDVHLQSMIQINGSILGFICGFLIPIFVHFKCVYYDRSSGLIKDDEDHNNQIKANLCQCDNQYSSKWTLYIETAAILFMFFLGLILMLRTIYGLFSR